MKYLILSLLLIIAFPLYAQQGDFPFGKVTLDELTLVQYPRDTSAVAVVLQEYGYAWITDEVKIIFEHHVKVKILKKEGLHHGTFQISLHKDSQNATQAERWLSVNAVTYNIENGRIKESPFNERDLLVEKTNKYYNTVKFALPDVKVGTVIEVLYKTESPYLFQFHNWEFQSDIPKVYSEYRTKIPAYFTYNIILRGFKELDVNDVNRVTDCFIYPGASTGSYGKKTDCSLSIYGMKDIPAFIEEDYLTSKKNFLSAIYFEMAERIDAYGSKHKYAEEWVDVVRSLEGHDYFGKVLKKARKLMDDKVGSIVMTEKDNLKKAQLLYDYIRNYYIWNGDEEKYTLDDPKKVFDFRKGNSADINFALIGALQAAGLTAYPVLVSTRNNGIPNNLLPQRSDFNYVIAAVKIGNDQILLDATDSFLPFGVLPIRCLNGRGRIVSKTSSDWVDLIPLAKSKMSVSMNMVLHDNGELTGTMKLQYHGYDAVRQRKSIFSGSDDEFVKQISKHWHDVSVSNYSILNRENINDPLVVEMDIALSGYGSLSPNTLYFEPHLIRLHGKNPFNSKNRQYPVDLGAPIETTYFMNLTLPEKFKVEESPESIAMVLPQNGGKCLLNVVQNGQTITLTSQVSLSRPLYDAAEYPYLKEFFARVIRVQQAVFVLRKT